MKYICVGATLIMALLFSAANAAVWYVQHGSGLHSIQAGLDSCAANDTVLVDQGTYYENLVWPNVEGIVLVSKEGPDKTKIDAGGNGSAVMITTGVESNAMIKGFTLTHGIGTQDPRGYRPGGGIYCVGSSPTIAENIITENESTNDGSGGGIYCVDGAPVIVGNVICDNYSSFWGGGIFIGRCSATVADNTIARNVSRLQGGGITIGEAYAIISGNTIIGNSNMGRCGGGIIVGLGSVVAITNNTIRENVAHSNGGGIDISYDCVGTVSNNSITENKSLSGNGGGIFIGWNSSATITQNTITENRAEYGGGIACYDNTNATITRNTITENRDIRCAGGVFLRCNSITTIDSCIIAKNRNDGIYCDSNSTLTAYHNDIYENKGYGMRNQDPAITVVASYNWWGHASGPGGVGPGTGDEVSDNVIFDPWLTEPFGSYDGRETAEVTQRCDNDDNDSDQNPIMLCQCLPNPFSKLTTVSFSIEQSAESIELKIYDAAGRLVRNLYNAMPHAPCAMQISWDGTDQSNHQLPGGVYFVTLQAGEYSETEKVLLVR